jgi:hypothetical protein
MPPIEITRDGPRRNEITGFASGEGDQERYDAEVVDFHIDNLIRKVDEGSELLTLQKRELRGIYISMYTLLLRVTMIEA